VNLHEWITARVEAVEAEHRSVVFVSDDGRRPIVGTVTEVAYTDEGAEFTVVPGLAVTAAVLRRCEADRRTLARHKVPIDGATWFDATICVGCGTYGDCDMPETDNINDCPELLDLAHAHGITEADLAALDRPQRPEPTPAQQRRLRERARLTVPITTADVPQALRGHRWKP
jgi:hypothetical protein